MRKHKITKAIAEAKRFIAEAEQALEDERSSTHWDHRSMTIQPHYPDGRVPGSADVVPGSRQSGRVRRASQDLSEALIEMRKP